MRHDEDITQGVDLRVFRKLFGYARAYRAQFAGLLLIMLSYSALDAAVPLLTRTAIDRFAVARQTEGFLWFAVACSVFALGRGLTVRLMIVTAGRVYVGLAHDIRRDAFAHLQKLSFSYFDEHPVGWLMARLTSDTQQLSRTLAWGMGDLIDGVAKLVLVTGIMLYLDVRLAGVVLAVVPVLALLVARYQAVSLGMFREVRRAGSEITGAFNEGITGARTTKTLVREEASLTEFAERTDLLREVSVRAASRAAVYLPLVLVFGTVASMLALWVGGTGVIAGDITYGTLVAFIAYAVSFFTPLQDIARRFPDLQNAQAATERIFAMLETEPGICDSVEAIRRKAQDALPDRAGNVCFEHVDFAYAQNEPVLRDFCLDLHAGETVALVGRTGVGKTTIASLLCRFYEPTAGRILVAETDYRDLPVDWLRSRLGIVLQQPHLFSGTVRDNIRYGRLDATDAEVEWAGRTVNAHDFIMDCQGGYEFDVGEGGANLSVGQKQLIALARLILADPEILILDEATSAVDTETEQLIQDAIDRVLARRTSIVIAHRLSTIRRADRIVLLGDDGINEQGTHRELIARRGAYYRLYTSQFVEEKEERLLRRA